MSGEELDLSGGGKNAGDEEEAKPKASSPKGGERSQRSQRRDRADIRTRLFAIFERLAERLEGRGDYELAAMVREDSRAMVGGLESLTKRVPGAAAPILWSLGVLEPVLAFGRIFRLLLNRWADRRASGLEEEEELEPEEPEAWPPA